MEQGACVLYLSWFSLYKVILLCKRITKDSFYSIVNPVENQTRRLSILWLENFSLDSLI